MIMKQVSMRLGGLSPWASGRAESAPRSAAVKPEWK